MYNYSVQHISAWCLRMSSLYLQNANGPSAEALLSFSDLTILLILPICFGVMSWLFLLLFRAPTVRFYLENQLLECIWTLTPALLLLLLAAPSLSLLYMIDEVGWPTASYKVQGHQWYWVYEANDCSLLSTESYLWHGPVRLLNTDTSLTVFSSLVLRILVTAADVLHSFALPSWGLKADAVPGRLNSLSTYLDRPGIYYGQCSEICGSNHSFMPISVQVLPAANRPQL